MPTQLQRDPGGSEVELKHPVVARRFRIEDGPDRRGGRRPAPAARPPPCSGGAILRRAFVKRIINCTGFRRLQIVQEFGHRTHNVGMRVEGSPGKTNIRRPVLATPLHPVRRGRTARRPEGRRRALPPIFKVGLHAEIFRRTSPCQPEAHKNLVEVARCRARRTCREVAAAIFALGRSIDSGAPATINERGSAGAPAFGCSACRGFTSTRAISCLCRSTAQRAIGQFR